MRPTKNGPAARMALAFGLVGAWLMLSASTSVIAPTLSDGAAPAATSLDQLLLAQADVAGTPVSFTVDQTDRGEERFKRDCQECHGDDLKGGMNGGPPLQGLAFESKYFEGAPASWMFDYMSAAMPPNSPGRYSASTYADLMAYILRRNGFQPGRTPLPSDVSALDNLIVEK